MELFHAPSKSAAWAIDIGPDGVTPSLVAKTAKILSTLFPDTIIHPMHAISPLGLSWNNEKASERAERLGALAEQEIDRLMDEGHVSENVKSLCRPFVFDCSCTVTENSVHSSARKLARWAKKFHSDLIVVNHSPAHGLARIFKTDFVESLIDESQLPLLIVTDDTKLPAGPISDIIFPTDFSESCQNTFEEALTWAKHFNASLKLFHKIEPRPGPVIASGALFGGWIEFTPYEGALRDEFNKCEEWLNLAVERGVHSHYSCEQTPLGTSEAIVHQCEQSSSPLLIMSTCHGPLESGLWGSITRDVLSHANSPVLVLRG